MISDYNTQRPSIVMPEYGRNVQRMVNHCVSIQDRDERNRCAQAIIATMGNLFPHLRDAEDFKYKLWDHLAIMSDFKLDIDYPYPVIEQTKLHEKPEKVDYRVDRIRYRHYGKGVEDMIKKAESMPEGDERDQLIRMLANHMKMLFLTWNKEVVDDEKIFADIAEYTQGKISINASEIKLKESKVLISGGNQQKKQKNKKR